MLILISLVVIIYMFVSSAKQANKNLLFWVILGVALWIVLGGLFLIITNAYIYHIDSATNTIPMEKWELVLQGISAAIITVIAFIIQKIFIKR
jgi:hypothetical protein